MGLMSLGPIPPYNNPPIQPYHYRPRRFVIASITLGQETMVTTNDPMDYVIGQLIRLLIPPGFGCVQLNELTGYVVDIVDAYNVIVTIDSSIDVNQFISATSKQQPQIIPVGDVNNGVISNTGANIPITGVLGAFINIS